MNFAAEVETLIRARGTRSSTSSPARNRVQQVVTDIARKRQKKVFERELQHRHRARRNFHPVPEEPQLRHQRTAALITSSNKSSRPSSFQRPHPFLTKSNYAVTRKLKEIALHLKNSFKTIIPHRTDDGDSAELEKRSRS